ncbi:hypothetical protein IAU60_002737 [Kwoniella sp. DSM 27419]
MLTQTAQSKTVFPAWNVHHWRAVDDRVRGGSSVSHLDEVEPPHETASEKHGKTAARFWGNLDTSTLGGAGFASQAYRYGPSPLQLPQISYSGLRVTYLPDPDTKYTADTPLTYTLILKTVPTAHIPKEPRIPPRPRESQLSYEATFSLPSHLIASHSGRRESLQATFTWDDFQATYRGRRVHKGEERWVPLDPGVIYELSFMCRSDFDKQKGDFGVVITSLEAVLKRESKQGWSVWTWLSGVQDWFRWMMGWNRIKLDDEERDVKDEKRALMA